VPFRVIVSIKRQRRIFWVALAIYAVWLTLALRHSIANHKPLVSLLVISIVPASRGRSAMVAQRKIPLEKTLNRLAYIVVNTR
jgi:hypothetical protein